MKILELDSRLRGNDEASGFCVFVIPVKTGIHVLDFLKTGRWIPA